MAAENEELVVRDLDDLAGVIRQRRRDENLTLDAAADRFGVGRRLLVELEAGRRNVGVARLLDLVQLLGYDVVLRRRRRAARDG
jgi:HTH-type transcriptional regulator/antitoxin HipB